MAPSRGAERGSGAREERRPTCTEAATPGEAARSLAGARAAGGARGGHSSLGGLYWRGRQARSLSFLVRQTPSQREKQKRRVEEEKEAAKQEEMKQQVDSRIAEMRVEFMVSHSSQPGRRKRKRRRKKRLPSVPLEEYKEIGFLWATTSGPVSVFFWFHCGYMFISLLLLFGDWVLPAEYTVWLFLDSILRAPCL